MGGARVPVLQGAGKGSGRGRFWGQGPSPTPPGTYVGGELRMEPAWQLPGVNELLRAPVPNKPQMLLFSQKEHIKN